MKRIGRVLLCFLAAISQVQLLPSQAQAVDSSTIVISHIIVGESSSASSELVALYNNTAADIDMTGYCIRSASAVTSSNTTGQIACIQADTNSKVYIKSHGFLTISSALFATAHTYTPDTTYATANKLLVGGDTLSIVNGSTILDSVTWGSAGLNAATNGTLQRKETSSGSSMLLDTDSPTDFSAIATLVYPANASYDVVTYVDVCPNISDVQPAMPLNYLADENGNCQPDSCLNIPGLQVNVPEFFDADINGNCTERDECANLEGKQHEIPEFMVRGNGNDCVIEYSPLQLTEIMPNAIGSDTGNEFIEIYNPTNQTIDLTLYAVKIGDGTVKSFPIGALIAPGEYRTFSDSLMKFTLVNTSSRVILTAVGGATFGDTGVYMSPPDGQSWALIEGVWQYTNRPTPGAPNLASLIEETQEDPTDSAVAPCPAGKYRNPLTNRCRNIQSDASVLATCDVDQYRNPETGRCRKISTTNLAPCKDNQYRSEETNRCRNIAAASTQKPCKDDQYRSEETGRCRNLAASSIPNAGFAVQPVKDSGMAFVGWWALAGVLAIAVGYAGWEWRREIMDMWRKLIRK